MYIYPRYANHGWFTSIQRPPSISPVQLSSSSQLLPSNFTTVFESMMSLIGVPSKSTFGEDGAGPVSWNWCRTCHPQRLRNEIRDRPGRNSEILAHLLPNSPWSWIRRRSSSMDQSSFARSGSSMPDQRSLHCFPLRPGTIDDIRLQFLVPHVSTALRRRSSSCGVHIDLRYSGCLCLGRPRKFSGRTWVGSVPGGSDAENMGLCDVRHSK